MFEQRTLGQEFPSPVVAIAARKRAELTQATIAELLGIGRSTVARIEQGYAPMPEPLLERWAEVCGVDVELLRVDLVAV